MDVILQLIGLSLIVCALGDVFMTVLVARYGNSIFSERIFWIVWRIAQNLTRRLRRERRQTLLIYAGPIALVCLVAAWIVGLQFGFAFIYWPMLGKSVLAQQGQPTDTSFLTALYISTDCLTTAGNGDFAPRTGFARLVTLLNCAFGITTITLAVTYLVQIYNGLRERNATAMQLHHATSETGDAAEWLASLSAGGTFEGASSEITRVCGQLASIYETYHFYASLLYFHFAEVHYAQARVALIVMDTAALAQALIDPDRHRNFVRNGCVAQLGRAGLHIAHDLADIYLPKGMVERCQKDPLANVPRWRQRFLAARDRLVQADVSIVSDIDGAFEKYVERRGRWDAHVHAFATYLEEPAGEVFAPDRETRERLDGVRAA